MPRDGHSSAHASLQTFMFYVRCENGQRKAELIGIVGLDAASPYVGLCVFDLVSGHTAHPAVEGRAVLARHDARRVGVVPGLAERLVEPLQHGVGQFAQRLAPGGSYEEPLVGKRVAPGLLGEVALLVERVDLLGCPCVLSKATRTTMHIPSRMAALNLFPWQDIPNHDHVVYLTTELTPPRDDIPARRHVKVIYYGQFRHPTFVSTTEDLDADTVDTSLEARKAYNDAEAERALQGQHAARAELERLPQSTPTKERATFYEEVKSSLPSYS